MDAMTPLQLAASEGNFDMAHLLLGAGANVNAVSGVMPRKSNDMEGLSGMVQDGSSALYLAVKNDLERVVRLLLDAGAIVQPAHEGALCPLALSMAEDNLEDFVPLLHDAKCVLGVRSRLSESEKDQVRKRLIALPHEGVAIAWTPPCAAWSNAPVFLLATACPTCKTELTPMDELKMLLIYLKTALNTRTPTPLQPIPREALACLVQANAPTPEEIAVTAEWAHRGAQHAHSQLHKDFAYVSQQDADNCQALVAAIENCDAATFEMVLNEPSDHVCKDISVPV
ncbi:hypothetical protein SDRG_15375 [Saprolegnia diclina VS20]|uniref:Uncharacterized protein n=1 Tax=Saprolegnia diclina (strain VS20) TaxID=1156394 RepID=T0PX04_SAPDV|nr:hypothetical protein SDRG_15375 [Saprolegnia diclina VS20]EQC26786.1 hypothetical protein SDRG_15375 [Saprolegnia diclina VS20]|eukprot:XP_008619768.1 hypothetical protein SDRG_15375 [Saprolegnia diclina VS20]